MSTTEASLAVANLLRGIYRKYRAPIDVIEGEACVRNKVPCNARLKRVDSTSYCTRPQGHVGDHVCGGWGSDGPFVIARWWRS